MQGLTSLLLVAILAFATVHSAGAEDATHPLVQWTFDAPPSNVYDFYRQEAGDGLTTGQPPAPVGYEMLEPWGSRHLSRSWGWQARSSKLGGLLGPGAIDPNAISLGLPSGFMETNDPLRMGDGNGGQGPAAGLGAAIGRELNIRLAGFYDGDTGGAQTRLMNAVASGAVPLTGDGVKYAVEGNWQESRPPDGAGSLDLWNVALYMGTEYGPTGVDVRLDYTDDQGILTTVSTDLWSLTVTGSWAMVDGVDFRVEYRHDQADDAVFSEDSTAGDDSLNTVQARVIWRPEP